MAFHRGDKVKESAGGPQMEVLASSDHLTLCSWQDDVGAREGIFETGRLHKVVMQQAQQPQADGEPDGSGPS